MTLRIELTEPQSEFYLLGAPESYDENYLPVGERCKYPLFVAGLGTGKTFTLVVCALRDAFEFPGARVGLYMPTYDLLSLNTRPRCEELLISAGVDHDLNKSANTLRLANGSELIFRSMDNPARIVGYESFSSHIDELDTMGATKAKEAFKKISERTRQKMWRPSIPRVRRTDDNVALNRISVYGTPDGGTHSFTYSQWHGNEDTRYKYVNAPTSSNPHLAKDYISGLMSMYDEVLVAAYLEGLWVNLVGGRVYRCYDKVRHRSREEVRPGERLSIGMDFNVTKMAAIVYVAREDGWHAAAEAMDLFDTPDMITHLKNRFPSNKIVVYPDASGESRKTVDASKSDLSLLRKAGFEVRVNPTNPSIKDRVNAVNARFTQGLLWVNDKACPKFCDGLERQPYNKDGMPDKSSGLDHGNDAGGYPIAYEFPVQHRVKGNGRTVGMS